jgi:CheY-like chemotaxis protein
MCQGRRKRRRGACENGAAGASDFTPANIGPTNAPVARISSLFGCERRSNGHAISFSAAEWTVASSESEVTVSTDSTGVPNVLIVEDEMILRMRAVDIVEDAGFHPVEAVNADEAISILESRSDISLLFTDIQMPGSIDGLTLAHAVHSRWPAIKIILVSGQVKPSEAERPADSRFFGKPLGVEQIVAELQAMVGAGALTILPEATVPPADDALRGAAAMNPSPRSAQEAVLSAENDSLSLLLEQAGIDAKTLLTQAGIDAKEREAADKLQKLILGELHHRIKNTLATVSAIASQSFRAATSIEQGQKAMEGRLLALGRAHDLLMQVSWANASLTHTFSSATEPYDGHGARRFHFNGPDIRITSGAVIALAMTFNCVPTPPNLARSLSQRDASALRGRSTSRSSGFTLSGRREAVPPSSLRRGEASEPA